MHRRLYISKKRSFQQNIFAALVWPFLFAAEDVFTFPKRRAFMGFVIFSAFAGLTLIPGSGSDAYTVASQIYYGPVVTKEPIIAFLVHMASFSGFGFHFYFMLLGLIYASVLYWSARLFFYNLPVNKTYSTAALVFMLAFFLNHPVFDALNARYQLGIWVMLLSTFLMLDGRWQLSLCIAVLGIMIHFGHSLFSLALVLLLLSRRLGRGQIIFAYVLLLVAFFMPSSLTLSFSDSIAQKLGGSFSEKVSNTVKLAEHNQLLSTGDSSGGYDSWFLEWFTTPIFYSLFISGHLLWWKIRKYPKDPQFQLWILIILMWALQFAMRGEPEGAGRVERNILALLLMWHARWFVYRRSGEFVALLINIAPMIFYFIVAYRRSVNDARIGAFLPSFYSYFTIAMPTVEDVFSWFH
jgi:hypothetical protein